MKTFNQLDASQPFLWHSAMLMGGIRIAGVAGTYMMQIPTGAFTKVWFIADAGSGLSNDVVATISNGNYGSPGIEPKANRLFFAQVADGVNAHAAKHQAD